MPVARLLYNLTVTLASPLAYPLFRLHPRGREKLSERYGLWGEIPSSGIWFHGASVGEIQGLLPIMKALRQNGFQDHFLCTVLSPTGLIPAQIGADSVHILPFDSTLWLGRVLKRFHPTAFIFGETELWPTLLAMLRDRNVPMHLVNGRISDYTVARYNLLRTVVQEMLDGLTTISVTDNEAAERFRRLGACAEHVAVCGNTKYDLELPTQSADQREELRSRLFPDCSQATRVVVLGSVHPTEDMAWYEWFRAAPSDVRLVVVPRHLEKLGTFQETLKNFDIPYALWTELERGVPRKVVLVDTMGVLRDLYGAADLAFVGGTFTDVGGHNVLEAAAHAVPIVVGPHTKNIRAIVAELLDERALVQVGDKGELAAAIDRILSGTTDLGVNARLVLERHRGATQRVIARLGLSRFTDLNEKRRY